MTETKSVVSSAARMSRVMRQEMANLDTEIAGHASEIRRLVLERAKLSAALVGLGDYGIVLTGTQPGQPEELEVDEDTKKIANIVRPK